MKRFKILAVTAALLAITACASPGPNQLQVAKEQHACAELGLAPGSAAFSNCFANLDATLFALNVQDN
jgi:hypothetical protein